MSDATRAEVCVVACAEVWRGDGEILASGIGLVPMIAARLARATFAPDLLVSDGEALLTQGTWAIGGTPPVIEGWLPFRVVFDLLYRGRRHVMMGPSQIDRYGNANISAIGADFARPDRALLGVRGAPGNTVSHPTSYWVPKHGRRSFVEAVDMVSGIGYDRAAANPAAGRYHELRRVVSNLGVFDFDTADHRMRLASVHPGVTVQEVLDATGFDLVVPPDVAQTRLPTDAELALIREVIDPRSTRDREVRG
ncbi:CoA-transferase [Dactylosporangium sp. AC04546]|uniref:CoA-transferase subunit beta n=1 Tax=Dactylosporangium sp. AC04546 TaxID=2862460 RepID=UPI001EE083EE|nr:CoA-transferase [Dactylosporangium sp. AC04546]WVK78324.1 CoA-transferase [Dactylosporangium sp. AC04546]